MEGKVKFFNANKGYGFIEREEENDLFFHVSEVQNNDEINDGDEVSFEVGEGQRGQLAKNVMKK